MLAAWERRVGLVNGVTLVAGEGLAARSRPIRVAYAISLMRRFRGRGRFPFTAMGNNMMTHREAYHSTGGYQRLSFSITEDYQLFRHILAKGFGFRQAFRTPACLAFTAPANPCWHLLQQRKRWMTGAMQLPWYQKLFVFAEALLVPAVVALAFFSPLLAAGVVRPAAALIVGEVYGAPAYPRPAGPLPRRVALPALPLPDRHRQRALLPAARTRGVERKEVLITND
jgi:hypothetical protein